MLKIRTLSTGRVGVFLAALATLVACGSDINTEYPRPSEPFESSLYDLIAGPIDRASALNVVSGRGLGAPLAVRVDLTGQWDVGFGVLDGQTVWLPRGFFDGFEAESGILALPSDFNTISEAPEDKDLYEYQDPVPMTEGTVYIIRSRNDPNSSLPCRIFAKVLVEVIEQDPYRVDLLYIWNPNCDNRILTFGPSQE